MAINRRAEAEWNGTVTEGNGKIKLRSGAFDGAYSFNSRFGDDTKSTNPEELIAAGHAGFFFDGFEFGTRQRGLVAKNITDVPSN